MKMPSLSRSLKIATILAMATLPSTLVPALAATHNPQTDDRGFEQFMSGNPEYILVTRNHASKCNISIRMPNRDSSETCGTVYTAVKPSGQHEFIFMMPQMALTITVPPGGRITPAGTVWSVKSAGITSRVTNQHPVGWTTPGKCIVDDNKRMTCNVDDGKVKISATAVLYDKTLIRSHF